MAFQTVFKRYELKYLLTKEQKEIIQGAMTPYMQLDDYGRTTIRNIYYDTDTYQLVRTSIEAPIYKEKLRIRSYSQAKSDSTVFVELKKKYESVVYKRRLALPESIAMSWISNGNPPDFTNNKPPDSTRVKYSDKQIAREIEYFRSYYKTLHPAVFLSYEREAYFSKDGSDFRVTFDDTILCREEDISLQAAIWGKPVLPEDLVLMEIKCSGGIPLWMTSVLSQNNIVKTSFSKYGTAYKKYIGDF